MKHIAGREGGRTPLREKRGQNENLLEISIPTPWNPLQRKRWTRRATPPSPAYTAKRGLSKNLLKISITTTWKISPRRGNITATWKISPRGGKYHHNVENITTTWKISPRRGKYHHDMENITTRWKISPRGGDLSNSTTTSSYCSHCNLLVARFLRILIYLLRVHFSSIFIPCCPSRLSVPSRILKAGAVAVVCRRLMIWEPPVPFFPGS